MGLLFAVLSGFSFWSFWVSLLELLGPLVSEAFRFLIERLLGLRFGWLLDFCLGGFWVFCFGGFGISLWGAFGSAVPFPVGFPWKRGAFGSAVPFPIGFP